jgi:signal transduction histidine kinase
MVDKIIYFGPLELTALILLVIGLSILGTLLIRSRLRTQEMQRLVDGFPFPAMIYRKGKILSMNAGAVEWKDKIAMTDVFGEDDRNSQTVVRTIPAVEGQSFQVRGVRLSSSDTLLLFEDLGAAQRQQAFYRNFIQNVSHELKTPLTVIQGHAAKMGSNPDDHEGWIASQRIISEETKRLTHLVDNLLTLARLESPSFTLDLAPIHFRDVLEESILELSELAEERQLTFNLNLASAIPRVRGDRPRLKQVVLNLLDNAIKYTHPKVLITINLSQDEQARRLVCSVQDTGEGIPEEDLPYIFEKLYRARRTRGRPIEGSGLGLTLAQEIIRAHGGEIRAQSQLDVGSNFTFTLPYAEN